VAEVLFHPEAEAEYHSAVAWYGARSARVAARFEAAVEQELALIESNPDLFSKYDDEHRYAVLRRFPYSLVFQVQPDRVYVIAVAHAARAPDYWQGRT
jgi:plasmid stabilization system protein ParE